VNRKLVLAARPRGVPEPGDFLPEHHEHGLERFGATLAMLFDGSHVGKLLIAL
jgi:hypothetical protein